MCIHLGDLLSKRESSSKYLIDSSLPTPSIIDKIIALKPSYNTIKLDCAPHFIREKQLIELLNKIDGCIATPDQHNYINTILIKFNN